MSESKLWRDEDTLRELYHEKGMSQLEVAEELDCGSTTVHKWLDKHDIPTRKQPQEKPPYFGVHKEGYEEVITHVDSGTKRVLIHRLVAVAEYGYDAVTDMYIHHKNNIPWDNRPSNLEPMSDVDHGEHHMGERDWSEVERDEKGLIVSW